MRPSRIRAFALSLNTEVDPLSDAVDRSYSEFADEAALAPFDARIALVGGCDCWLETRPRKQRGGIAQPLDDPAVAVI